MTRKELVQALEEKWHVKAKYLGIPSYEYEIQCQKGTFQIDRQGIVRNQEGQEFSIEELLDKAEKETRIIEKLIPQVQIYVFELPLLGHTIASLRNFFNMIASKQHLLILSFELQEPLIEHRVAVELSTRDI